LLSVSSDRARAHPAAHVEDALDLAEKRITAREHFLEDGVDRLLLEDLAPRKPVRKSRSAFCSSRRSLGTYAIVIVPKSGAPVSGQIEVNSGKVSSTRYGLPA
jgi:hypothetical protein